MTDKEKLKEIKKLADTMYYAAQYLTTDASRLHKAMDEYHQFIINEYHKEEPVSEELEEAAKRYATEGDEISSLYIIDEEVEAFKAGAKWQRETIWKSADGNDLPEIDKEVIALLNNGKVVFAHRPPEFWDGKDIVTGKVTRNYPKTYDKGGWNIPDVKFWLDVEFPKEMEL